MYIKLIYSTNTGEKKLESLRAVDHNDKSISLELSQFVGDTFNDGLKKKISNLLKGYFVMNWVHE